MIVESLALENFMRYRKRCALDLGHKKTVGIVGPNEVGKSSLLQAISYGIYGRTRAEREVQLINDQADGDLVVELALRFPDDTLLEITRGRTAKNEAILKVAGLSQATKPADVAAHIADVVRLSYDDFIGLSYFLQGDLHQFMTGNKRAYFQRWTAGLHLWQRYEAAAGVKLLELEENIIQADFELSQCAESLAAAEETKGEARAARVEAQQARDQVAVVQEQVGTLQDHYQRMAESAADVRSVTKGLRKELQEAQAECRNSEGDLARRRSGMDRVRSGKCPVLANVDCRQLKAASDSARKKHQQAIEQLTIAIRNRRRAVGKVEKRLDAAETGAQRTYLKELGDRSTQVKRAQGELRDANIRLRRAASRFDRAKAAIEALRSARKVHAAVMKDRARWQSGLRRMQFLKYMCGKEGIPAQLIEGELERVEDRCNWVLERLDYSKRIRFSGYKELVGYLKVCPSCGCERWHKALCKDCGAARPRQRREDPTVMVFDGSVERPFVLESGGAQVLQSFAVRLAGGLFVSSMSGVPMRMVMLDEVFGHLDRENQQKLLALVIDKLASEFGLQQQFVVSHQEIVANAVDDLLVVTSERGGAVARWA